LGVAIALLSGALGWGARDVMLASKGAREASQNLASEAAAGNSFARRAVVAHAVFSPDARRPVEVDAAHEDQLVMWLTKRMGTPMKAPHLQTLGYTLEGGRLLPGDQGPVSQFMYRDEAGGKLTLYVSKEIGELNGKANKPTEASNTDTAFRFSQQGKVNVFYWVDGPLGYAISSEADRPTLAKVSSEVYQQLTAAH
jgi:anti-sigma factor RsiW